MLILPAALSSRPLKDCSPRNPAPKTIAFKTRISKRFDKFKLRT